MLSPPLRLRHSEQQEEAGWPFQTASRLVPRIPAGECKLAHASVGLLDSYWFTSPRMVDFPIGVVSGLPPQGNIYRHTTVFKRESGEFFYGLFY